MCKNKKLLSFFSAVSVSAFFLTSCADDGENGNGGDAGAVAMSFAGRDIQLWNDMLPFMEDYLEDHGYNLISDNPEWDAQTQANNWESWIVGGEVEAIMGFPVQADSMVGVTTQANEFDIPVLGYTSTWDGVEAAVLMDHRADGEMLGTSAAEWIEENYGDEEVDVALLSYPDTDLGRLRGEGIRDGLESKGLNLNINEHSVISLDDGYTAVQDQLNAFPATKVWLVMSNDPALGAYQALTDAGVEPDDEDILLGSIDGTDAEVELVAQEGSIWRLLYMVPAREIAESNAQMLIDAAEGESVEDTTLQQIQVTEENAEDFLLENQ